MWVGCGDAAEVAVAEAVAVAFEGDNVGVVDESVDHGGGDDVVAEHLSPAAELLVGGDDEAGVFVAGGDELEEQVRRFGLEGDVANLIDLCGYPQEVSDLLCKQWLPIERRHCCDDDHERDRAGRAARAAAGAG